MLRRSPSNRLTLAISLIAGLLALSCFIAAPALAAAENEAVSTLTTVMSNFDAQPAQTFRLATRDGEVVFRGWVNTTNRNGYIRFLPGTEFDSQVIITPRAEYTKSRGKRCWTRKRKPFSNTQVDSLEGVDMNTVLRRSENQILFESVSEGARSQITVTYDLATLLPSRFEIAAENTETGESVAMVQEVIYTTPSRTPKPGRVCKGRKRR
ncbi:MAG: hypothetical protein HZB14_09215 [Actinobacteria bacterium]|nr:hypothetical protein [Actinomycetota bacterium]